MAPFSSSTRQGFPLAGSAAPSIVRGQRGNLVHGGIRILVREQATIEADVAAVRDGVRRLGKTADVIDRQSGRPQLRMRCRKPQPIHDDADHLQRAGDRVAARCRPAAVTRTAMHPDDQIDATAIAETDAVAGPVENGQLRAYAGLLQERADSVVTAGFARDATREHELTGQPRVACQRTPAPAGSQPSAPSARSGPCRGRPRRAGHRVRRRGLPRHTDWA